MKNVKLSPLTNTSGDNEKIDYFVGIVDLIYPLSAHYPPYYRPYLSLKCSLSSLLQTLFIPLTAHYPPHYRPYLSLIILLTFNNFKATRHVSAAQFVPHQALVDPGIRVPGTFYKKVLGIASCNSL